MSGVYEMEKKKVIKLFLTWQDEKEQSWLEKKLQMV